MKGAALREGEYVDVSQLFQHAADQVPQLAKDIGGIQKPLIAAPRGTSFDIGQLKTDDKSLIPLAQVKPMLLRPLLINPDEGDDNLTRDLADPQATKLEAESQRLQRVTNDINILLAARGQIASNALLSSEEFAVGGINSGRGYDPSEITGDHGISGKIELQWTQPIKFDTQNFVESYQLYGFYDIGRVWNEDATTASQERDSLASVGGGVRFDLPYDVEGGLGVAFPMTRDVATQDSHHTKYYFNLSKRF